MFSVRKLIVVFAGVFATLGYAAPASAQATRTWVSGVGDDVNPCSRTAPCKTFAGAISKTATAGEINCLDPGGFGGLTIIKSISIVCDYTEGGVLSAGAGVNGFVINAPLTSVVFLSGIDFNGAGNAQNGLRIIAGGTVHLQNSIIRNYQASNGLGISYQPSVAMSLTVLNTTIADNGTGATGGGILVQPTGVGGTARLVLNRVRLQSNANNNLFINTTGNNGAGISVMIEDSEISNSGQGISVLQPVGTAAVAVMLNNSQVFGNSGTGILTNGGAALVRVGNTTITGNGLGVNATNGSVIQSFGTNRLFGNPAIGVPNNGAFSGAVQPQN